MKLEEIYEKELDEMFWNVFNNDTLILREKNQKYADNCKKLCDIVKNEKLCAILEEYEPEVLSKNDMKSLIEYVKTLNENHLIESKQIFLSGAASSIYFLKQLNLIKGELEID